MSRIQQISGNFISAQYSGISNSIVTNYLSATTLFGNIDAKYIGTGSTFGEVPNWVNNSEFSYLSGITAHVQTQINTKLPLDTPLITYAQDNRLTDYKILKSGLSINTELDTNYYNVDATFDYYNPVIIYDTPTIPATTTKQIIDYSPSGLNSTIHQNRSTHIMINPTGVTQIRNISATPRFSNQSRLITLTNVGKYLIILAQGAASTLTIGRFVFPKFNNAQLIGFNIPIGHFLLPNKSITFILYNNLLYPVNYDLSKIAGLDFFDRFAGLIEQQGYNAINYINFNSKYFSIKSSILQTDVGGNYWTGLIRGGDGQASDANLEFSILNYMKRSTNPEITHILPRVSIGLFDDNKLQNVNGNYFLFHTSHAGGSGALYPENKGGSVVDVIGTQNGIYLQPYTAFTNNGVTFPNFSGGTFILGDSGVSQNAIACVQTSDGRTITADTQISITNMFKLTAYKNTIIYTVNPSGASFGDTTFIIVTANTESGIYIMDKITHTGSTIGGYPSYTYYNRTNNPIQYPDPANVNNTTPPRQRYLYHMGMSIGSI